MGAELKSGETGRIITPNEFDCNKSYRIFLAGGITGCPDWQQEVCDLLLAANWIKARYHLLNPRREVFDVNDPGMSREQILWEYKMLGLSDAVMFWFPKETLCPITLYELGAQSRGHKPLFVGCHPEYARKTDVKIQLELARKDVVVLDSLMKVMADVMSHLIQLPVQTARRSY